MTRNVFRSCRACKQGWLHTLPKLKGCTPPPGYQSGPLYWAVLPPSRTPPILARHLAQAGVYFANKGRAEHRAERQPETELWIYRRLLPPTGKGGSRFLTIIKCLVGLGRLCSSPAYMSQRVKNTHERRYHLLQTPETLSSSGRHRQEKIPRSSSSGRESQETPARRQKQGFCH